MPRVYKDEDGKVIEVQMDEKLSADHENAVQVPPEADGRNQHPLEALLEPSPLEAIAAEQEKADKD